MDGEAAGNPDKHIMACSRLNQNFHGKSHAVFVCYVPQPPKYSLHFFTTILFFFFNDTATTEISPLSLHDALPISVRESASTFVPLAADADSLDGLNASCALIDELHAHKTRAVHDVIDSSTGSRRQPLIWKITTAGSNRAGVCYDQRTYGIKVLNQVLKRHGGMGYRVEGEAGDDESFFVIIYTIDEGDDVFDEAIWRKANPNYGISVDPDDLQRMAAIARGQRQAPNEFRTKRVH